MLSIFFFRFFKKFLCFSGEQLINNVVLVSGVQQSDSVIRTSSVQSLSCVWLFATPWTAARQASLSFTISRACSNSCHWVSDAIQPSHPLSSPSPPAFYLFAIFIHRRAGFFFFFSKFFPILVTTEYWVEFPGLYSRSFVVIYFVYSSVCMSGPNSQFVTAPPPFPFGNPTFVFYVYESVSFLYISSFVFFKIPHISDIMWYLSLSDLLHLVW